jgi:hypothetical protein
MTLGVCILFLNPLADRLLQIVEVGVKPIYDMRVGSLPLTLKILKHVAQIGVSLLDSGEFLVLRRFLTDVLDSAPELLSSVVKRIESVHFCAAFRFGPPPLVN